VHVVDDDHEWTSGCFRLEHLLKTVEKPESLVVDL
jgi:hypothetical protein